MLCHRLLKVNWKHTWTVTIMRADHAPMNLGQRAYRERLAHEDRKETKAFVEKLGQREKLGRRDTLAILGTRVRKVKRAILDLKDQLGQLDLREPLGLFLCFVRPHVPGGTLINVVTNVEMGVAVKQDAQLGSMWLDLVSIQWVIMDVTTPASTVALFPRVWNFFRHYCLNYMLCIVA